MFIIYTSDSYLSSYDSDTHKCAWEPVKLGHAGMGCYFLDDSMDKMQVLVKENDVVTFDTREEAATAVATLLAHKSAAIGIAEVKEANFLSFDFAETIGPEFE